MELLQVLKLRLQQVSGHSGLRGYLQVFFRASDVRVGALVGKHKYGNKCYKDNKHKFIWTNHKFNVSGTPQQYVPYSTTRKKIQEWVPHATPY
eukprot:bmy_20226T0